MTDDPLADVSLEDPLPAPAPSDPAPSSPATVPTTRLIGASFDLLARARDEMRRASFHIGLVTLGILGPLIVAFWWLGSAVTGMTVAEAEVLLAGPVGLWLNLMLWPALAGFIVLIVESRTMAIATLAARCTERPLSIDQSIARSRRTFWRVLIAMVVVAIPITLAQRYVERIIDDVSMVKAQAALPAALIVTIVVGAPLAYVLSAVVLGDLGPIGAIGRSWRVFRARMLASVVVALFESISVLLIVLGLSAGLDVVGRVLDSIGFGSDQGIVSSIVVTVALLAASFAFGTLVYTVTALALTPQVVMFVGHHGGAVGLDPVHAGGRDDPTTPRPGARPFRRFTRPLLIGMVIAWVGLVGLVMQLRL